MKVLYIVHSSGIQGSGNAVLNIIDNCGKDITPVVLLPRDGTLRQILISRGVKCYVSPHQYYNFLYPHVNSIKDFLLYMPRVARIELGNYMAKRYLRELVLSESPDVIHTNTGVLPIGADIADEFNIPHVWHIREYMNESEEYNYYYLRGYKYFTERLKRKNTHCIAITNAMFDYYKLDRAKDKVIYDGVFSLKENGCSKDNKNNSDKYLLFVGTLSKGKGIFDALQAFEAIHKQIPDFHFCLAGNDADNVSEYVSKLECRSKVKLLGFRRDIYQIMANAEALIVPSLYEGFGFISVEAMLNKCLVIGRNTAGIKEQFDNGIKVSHNEIGLRFDDVEGLKRQILKAVSMSKEEKDTILNAAYSTVKQLYSSEVNTNNLLDLYNEIIWQKHV